MNWSIRKRIVFGLILTGPIFFFSGCGDNNNPSVSDNSKDRGEILIHWADNIILPSYAAFDEKFDQMVGAGNSFTTTPNGTTLAAFRTAWVDAYIEWQNVAMFEFGPASDVGLRSFFNVYPTDVPGINANIVDPSRSLTTLTSDKTQGFPALDYLINGVGASDQEIIGYFTEPNGGAARLAYVTRLLDRMDDLLTSVIDAWDQGYRDSFVTKTGLDASSSTSLVVNAYIMHYEAHLRTGKIGIPAGVGVSTTGTAFPDKVEAFYKKDISKSLARAAHSASFNFFKGVDVITLQEGPSLKSYLDALEVKDQTSGTLLSTIIEDQFDLADDKLKLLSDSFYNQIQTNNQGMVDAFAELQKIVRLLKVDMTSGMSITITYFDNDGD